jgi:hypothetical protein
LWGVDDVFVKSIVTLPALALSDVVLYISAPEAAADRATFEVPAAAAGVAGVVGVVGVVGFAGAVPVVVVEFDDPHPAIARTPSTQMTDAAADFRRIVFNTLASSCRVVPPILADAGDPRRT